MAEAKNTSTSHKALSTKIDALDGLLDDIYNDTFSATNTDRNILSSIDDDIYRSINKILSTNSDIQALPDIAQLYTRIEQKNNNSLLRTLSDALNDNDLIGNLMANPEINRYIKSKNLQIDMILKYMPKLKEALKIKKDNVLCADSFTKEFISVSNPIINTDGEEAIKFNTRIKRLMDKYDIENKIEASFDDAAKYGERFWYIVPYKKAYERLKKSNTNNFDTPLKFSPFGEVTIMENGNISDKEDLKLYKDNKDLMNDLKNTKTTVKLSFNETGLIPKAIRQVENIEKVKEMSSKLSVSEAFFNETNTGVENKGLGSSNMSIHKNNKKVAPDDLEYDKLYNKANDGLMSLKNPEDDDMSKVKDIPGCVMDVLKREDVIPVYIDDICMGYYYVEFSYTQNEDLDRSRMLLNDTFQSVKTSEVDQNNDMLIKYVADKISKYIDSKFINANQDLKDEIYAVLKYNNRFNKNAAENMINVTYIPPQDIYHYYHYLDPETHRGISEIEDGLMPALFYVLLSLSAALGYANRSQDHRVYYVKQNIETNIAKTLMNVINQIKKGNFGIRQMQSMNNILGIIGRYNDFIIPVGPSGEAGLSFDTLPGQDIKTPEELLNRYEEQAINSIEGISLEMVSNAMNVDYATRYTMTNSKLLRAVMKLQSIVQKKAADIIQLVYNYEYGENEQNIQVSLPMPVFLMSVNGTALLNNVKDYKNAIMEALYPDGLEISEKEKAIFSVKFIQSKLDTYFDYSLISKLMDEAKMESKIEPPKAEDLEDTDDEL